MQKHLLAGADGIVFLPDRNVEARVIGVVPEEVDDLPSQDRFLADVLNLDILKPTENFLIEQKLSYLTGEPSDNLIDDGINPDPERVWGTEESPQHVHYVLNL